MSMTRRQLLRTIDRPASPWFEGHSPVAQTGAPQGRGGFQRGPAAPADAIQIGYNENPLGPSPKAQAALATMYTQAGRYPFNSMPSDADLAAAIARKFGAAPAQVVLGAGSGELLRNAVRAFTSPARGLVVASPTYGTPAITARLIKTPLREVPVDAQFRLDLDAMAAAATGAGLVFVCNPNNPTATVHSAARVTAFVDAVHRASPDTVVMIDEAYHDYVTDPAYSTSAPLALARPNVLMLRTFSKAHGMAALRLGYALGQPKTADALGRYRMPYNTNNFVIGAGLASVDDETYLARERARNTEVRAFTLKVFADLGFTTTDSQTNFILVDLKRPAREFAAACAAKGILVGREFPPLEKTHTRISVGTMDEMRKAADVFKAVLTTPATAARG